jgi:hypothetical protein
VTFATQQEVVFAWFPWERPTPEKPSGSLVVDRKMSSGTTASAFPGSPISPAVHVSWPTGGWRGRESGCSDLETLSEEPGALDEKKKRDGDSPV